MSSYPGPSLEDQIEDNWGHYSGSISDGTLAYNIPPPEIYAKLLAFYEPHRERIEERVAGFPGDDEASWRDYRTIVWDDIPKPPESVFERYKFEGGKYIPIEGKGKAKNDTDD
jgi:hypothetical protein